MGTMFRLGSSYSNGATPRLIKNDESNRRNRTTTKRLFDQLRFENGNRNFAMDEFFFFTFSLGLGLWFSRESDKHLSASNIDQYFDA